MNIHITSAGSEGPTELAAFDTALINAGIANHNLIYLSSIIPPDSNIKKGPKGLSSSNFGDRLYVVMSEHRTSNPGQEVWSGIGWVQNDKKAGLFVEHHGYSKKEVEADIRATLKKMMLNRKNENWKEIEMEITGIRCKKEPVCALVVAVYKSEPW